MGPEDAEAAPRASGTRPFGGLRLGVAALGIHVAAFLLPIMLGERRMPLLQGPFHVFVQSHDWPIVFALATNQAASFALTLWLGSHILGAGPQARAASQVAGAVGGVVWGGLMAAFAWFAMTFCVLGCPDVDDRLVALVVGSTALVCGLLFFLSCVAARVRAERRQLGDVHGNARRLDLWFTATSLAFATWGLAASFLGPLFWFGLPTRWVDVAVGTAPPAAMVGLLVALASATVLRGSVQPLRQAVLWAWLPAALWASALVMAYPGALRDADAWVPLAARILVSAGCVFAGIVGGGLLARGRGTWRETV